MRFTASPGWRGLALLALGFVEFIFSTCGVSANQIAMPIYDSARVVTVSGTVQAVEQHPCSLGILFALGTTLPAWSRLSEFSWDGWIPFGLFAVLCSLNCLAIECWEKQPRYPDWFQSRSPVIRWAETRINQLAAALAASAFAVILVRRHPGPFRRRCAEFCRTRGLL